MKRFFKMAALALVIVLGSSLQNKTSAQNYSNRGDVSYQTFYDELSPHGRWVDYPNYGYVWVPDAGPDFRPYSTNGHWVWTDDYEWMWVSDYDWGWAPFHYGRWEEDPYYGWFWVPGYEWSPAWVAWRNGGDYYGWAPLRPGISISINFNIGGYSPPYNYWCFAPRRYITSPRIYDYYIDRRQNITIINYTTIIVNNYHYSSDYGFRSGPRRYDAERYCGRINPVRFRDSYSPGRTSFRNNEVSVYRPNVRHDDDRRFAPGKFDRYERSNSNRTERNDNGFRRNDDNVNDRGNNQESNRRDNNDFRQPGNNNSNGRFDRNDNNGQTKHSNDNRIIRPSEKFERNPNQGNNNNNSRFERPNNNNGNNNTPRQQDVRSNDQPQRQPHQQMERRQEPQHRQFERRDDNNGNRNTPFRQQEVRSNDQPQRQPHQQMERRQEPQSRQFEQSNDVNRRQNAGEGNNGRGNGRRRF